MGELEKNGGTREEWENQRRMGELEKNGGTREEWGNQRRMGELEKNGGTREEWGNQRRMRELEKNGRTREEWGKSEKDWGNGPKLQVQKFCIINPSIDRRLFQKYIYKETWQAQGLLKGKAKVKKHVSLLKGMQT